MSSISFVLTIEDSGYVTLDKCEEGWLDYKRDESFTKANMSVGDAIDLHTKTGEDVNPASRLVRLTVEDDTIPKFASMDEADEWLEGRKSFQVLS